MNADYISYRINNIQHRSAGFQIQVFIIKWNGDIFSNQRSANDPHNLDSCSRHNDGRHKSMMNECFFNLIFKCKVVIISNGML